MIEQLSNAVKFVAFYVASKIGKTGLTVTVDVHGADGSEIVTAGAASEIGDGLYGYTLSGSLTGTEGTYLAVFKTADTTVDQQHIPSLWCIGVAGVEKLDAAVSTRNAATPPSAAAIADQVWDEAIAGHVTAGSTGQALGAAGAASDPLLNPVPGAYASGTAGAALGRVGSGQIITVSPVGQSGDVEVVAGDDYDAADGRALEWTDAGNSWPDLTGGTVQVVVGSNIGATFAGSIVVASGAGKKVRLELTAIQSAQVKPGRYSYRLKTTAGGDTFTLAQGDWVVR